jgi:hypothetical protein
MVTPPFGKKVADLAMKLGLPPPRKGTIKRSSISKLDATKHGPAGQPWRVNELCRLEQKTAAKEKVAIPGEMLSISGRLKTESRQLGSRTWATRAS